MRSPLLILQYLLERIETVDMVGYCPPYNDHEYTENLTDSINCIVSNYKNSTTGVGPDF